jgi:ribosome-interacting GTPase 1
MLACTLTSQLLFKEDCSVDDLIDVIEGNRRYVKCLYVYNKVRWRVRVCE